MSLLLIFYLYCRDAVFVMFHIPTTKTILFCYFYYWDTVGIISTKQYYFLPRFFRSKRGESGDRAKTRKSKTPDPFSDTEISPERGHRRPNPQIKVSQVYSTLIWRQWFLFPCLHSVLKSIPFCFIWVFFLVFCRSTNDEHVLFINRNQKLMTVCFLIIFTASDILIILEISLSWS